MKTTSVAIIMCLNIGVDPPDVLKARAATDAAITRDALARAERRAPAPQVSPCARAECWVEPAAQQPQKALDAIGKALQLQYERWQPRARRAPPARARTALNAALAPFRTREQCK